VKDVWNIRVPSLATSIPRAPFIAAAGSVYTVSRVPPADPALMVAVPPGPVVVISCDRRASSVPLGLP
jgi:hypothetical protein